MHLDLDIGSDVLRYFDIVNRGGLTYPSNFMFNIIQRAYNIFNVCISQYEESFLRVGNQKQTLLGVFEKHLTGNSYFNDELAPCEVCGCKLVSNVMRSLSCFANILLKNYSNNKSESFQQLRLHAKFQSFRTCLLE